MAIAKATLRWLSRHRDMIIVMATVIGLWGYNYASNVHTRDVQEQQGNLVEQRLCHTLDTLEKLHPPTRANAPNGPYPASFRYLDNLHKTLAQLGPDVGCP